LLSSKRIVQINEENESCIKRFELQIRFSTFLAHISSKEAAELARKGPEFP
jgi:hypothetical protein